MMERKKEISEEKSEEKIEGWQADDAAWERLEALAKLSLTSEEREGFSQDLALLMRFAASLPDPEEEEAHAEGVPWEGLRADVPKPSLSREALLDSAPQVEDGYLLVPSVMGEASELGEKKISQKEDQTGGCCCDDG